MSILIVFFLLRNYNTLKIIMLIVRKKKILRSYLIKQRIKNQIAFIPTMGSIHRGHLSLIKNSKKKKCITCVSIFVNPAQFNNNKDFRLYPKNEKKDLKLLKKNGCDIVFLPDIKEIYPKKIRIKRRVKKYRNILCDKFRPNHFDGVTEVISRLFKLVKPNFVFFGEKDYQQLKIIKELVRIEKKSIKIISCPSVRDNNKMSLSTRYKLFSRHQKNLFQGISKIILKGVYKIKKGNKISTAISNSIKELNKKGIYKIEYIEVRKNTSLKLSKTFLNSRLFIALHLDDIRIIDNFIL